MLKPWLSWEVSLLPAKAFHEAHSDDRSLLTALPILTGVDGCAQSTNGSNVAGGAVALGSTQNVIEGGVNHA